MWPYWLFFMLPAMLAIGMSRRAPSAVTGLHSTRLDAVWGLIVLFFTLVIGLRVQVGGDWGAYIRYVERIRYYRFLEVFTLGDPGYQLINWLSAKLGWHVWGVNLFCGLVFSLGLTIFCRSLPRPWLAMTAAVPYLITVVAMGYTRQGVALGFAMLGLVALGRRQTAWFVFWVLLGATIHKSAVLLLPIAALANTRNRYITAAWVGVATLIAYFVLLQDEVDALYQNYVVAEYQSQGALIRTAMNAVPALLLLVWYKRFPLAQGEAPLWRWFAIISLALMVVLLGTPASTAVDRVALYMLPLQLVVFSHFPEVWGRRPETRALLVLAVVAYYALVHICLAQFCQPRFCLVALPQRSVRVALCGQLVLYDSRNHSVCQYVVVFV